MEQSSTADGQSGRKGRVVPYQSGPPAGPPQSLQGTARPANIAHDIARLRRAEREIEISHRFLQTILNSYPGNVAVIDDVGIVVITNESWAAFGQANGLDPKLFRGGANYLDVCRTANGPWSEGAHETAEALEAILHGQRTNFEMEYPCHSPDQKRWYHLQAQGFAYEDRRWAILAHVDITARKQAEEAMIQAQRALLEQQCHEKERVEADLACLREELIRATRLATIGQVSASIAHDLRNPLGAVRNATFLLKRRVPQESHLIDLLKIIDQEVTKADQIISRLLSMTRGEPPREERIDLGRTIQEVFGKTEGVGDIRLMLTLNPEPFWVHADPIGLIQLVSNLLTNAVQAMGGKGTLSVQAVHDAGYDNLVFRDTGPGIVPTVMSTLFDPLITTKAKGTGLGLTICRQIVEKHAGTIQAANAPEGGAAFTIRLPRA